MDIDEFVNRLGETEYAAVKRAVELGKWPDGRVLDAGEKALLLQAMIAWEARHLPPEQHTGYLVQPDCPSTPLTGDAQTLRFRE